MSTATYNSAPASPDVLLRSDGSWARLRNRQTPAQVAENEVDAL